MNSASSYVLLPRPELVAAAALELDGMIMLEQSVGRDACIYHVVFASGRSVNITMHGNRIPDEVLKQEGIALW